MSFSLPHCNFVHQSHWMASYALLTVLSIKEKTATLTHTFPSVCKQFHWVCHHIDYLWKVSLRRLVRTQPKLWGSALQTFLDSNCSEEEGEENHLFCSNDVERACRIMQKMIDRYSIHSKDIIHAQLYRHLLSKYIRCEMPVFFMPDDMITRGRSIGFHFSEPRYRRLIWEVMEPYPDEFRRGLIPNVENGVLVPPQFIYAHRSPLKPGMVACIVHVLHCNINQNGTATLEVAPVDHVRIEKVFEQNDASDHLHFAKFIKLQEEEQDLIEIRDIQKMYPYTVPS